MRVRACTTARAFGLASVPQERKGAEGVGPVVCLREGGGARLAGREREQRHGRTSAPTGAPAAGASEPHPHTPSHPLPPPVRPHPPTHAHRTAQLTNYCPLPTHRLCPTPAPPLPPPGPGRPLQGQQGPAHQRRGAVQRPQAGRVCDGAHDGVRGPGAGAGWAGGCGWAPSLPGGDGGARGWGLVHRPLPHLPSLAAHALCSATAPVLRPQPHPKPCPPPPPDPPPPRGGPRRLPHTARARRATPTSPS